MRFEKTREEALKDKALVLALLARVHNANGGEIGDRLKIQKLCFLLTYELFGRRIKALNYTFFTYRWGPFTNDLYEAEADFEQAGLLYRHDARYRLTESGLALGNSIYGAISNLATNAEICEVIEKVVENFSRWSSEELVKYAHGMSVFPLGWRQPEILDDLPLHLDLTRVLDDEEATAILDLEPGWLISFGMELDRARVKQSLGF